MSEAECIPVPANVQDLTGRRSGRLLVVGLLPKRDGRPKEARRWKCACDCGAIANIVSHSLTKKDGTRSCGCLQREVTARRSAIHGHARTLPSGRMALPPEYVIWSQLKARCTNPACTQWKWYGGRGISVCQEWLTDYQAFISHIGPRPSKGHSLDRIDNSRNYEPGNVRWATRKEQMRNCRFNVIITHEGQTKSLAAWAEDLGIKYHTLHAAVRNRGEPFAAVVARLVQRRAKTTSAPT